MKKILTTLASILMLGAAMTAWACLSVVPSHTDPGTCGTTEDNPVQEGKKMCIDSQYDDVYHPSTCGSPVQTASDCNISKTTAGFSDIHRYQNPVNRAVQFSTGMCSCSEGTYNGQAAFAKTIKCDP